MHAIIIEKEQRLISAIPAVPIKNSFKISFGLVKVCGRGDLER